MLKISYTIWKKHGENLYCRVRQAGLKPLDINLHTTDMAKAEAFAKLRRAELDLYNSYLLAGESVPPDVASKLLRRDNPAVAQKVASKAPVSLKVCLDQHEADMRRRGLREQSISAYMRALAVTVPEGAVLSDVNTKNIVQWLSKHDKLKSATRKLYSIALREFYKYLAREYNLSKDLIIDWPVMVKAESAERDYWTMQQMAAIINHVECKDKKTEKEFKAYLWVLATVGSRQGETGLLEWRDFKDGCLTFRAENTKGKQTRTVPLDPRIADMLYRMKLESKTDLIFGSIPKTQPARFQMLKYAIRRAGVPRGGLHQFRHSVSMLMYKTTNDLKATSQLLGHGEQTALRYYQKARPSEDLRKVVKETYENQVLLPTVFDDLIEAGLL